MRSCRTWERKTARRTRTFSFFHSDFRFVLGNSSERRRFLSVDRGAARSRRSLNFEEKKKQKRFSLLSSGRDHFLPRRKFDRFRHSLHVRRDFRHRSVGFRNKNPTNSFEMFFCSFRTFFLVGPMNQLKKMFDPSRLIATIVFLGAIVMTLVSALVVRFFEKPKANEKIFFVFSSTSRFSFCFSFSFNSSRWFVENPFVSDRLGVFSLSSRFSTWLLTFRSRSEKTRIFVSPNVFSSFVSQRDGANLLSTHHGRLVAPKRKTKNFSFSNF